MRLVSCGLPLIDVLCHGQAYLFLRIPRFIAEAGLVDLLRVGGEEKVSIAPTRYRARVAVSPTVLHAVRGPRLCTRTSVASICACLVLDMSSLKL